MDNIFTEVTKQYHFFDDKLSLINVLDIILLNYLYDNLEIENNNTLKYNLNTALKINANGK
jgi:hypothetical protein